VTNQVGVALIGAGGIGVLRADAVAKAPSVALRVVADIREDVARGVAGPRGAEWIADWRAAITRDDVGLVIVSTPPNLHAEMVLAAIEQGKNVLCEKPLAHTVDDAKTMCERADAAGVKLYTGFNHRYFPAMRRMRAMIDRGDLGDIVTVQAYAGHPGGEEFGHDWIHDGRVTGGGALVDNGIHILDLVRFFGGDATHAVGAAKNLVWPFETAEDFGTGVFRGANGAVLRVTASWVDFWGYRFFVEVTGTRGYARASYPPMRFDWSLRDDGRRHRDWFPVFQVVERIHGWQSTVVDSFVRELADVAAGGGSAATGTDGLRAIQMANAVYRASSERREAIVE